MVTVCTTTNTVHTTKRMYVLYMDLRTEIIFPCSTNWITPVKRDEVFTARYEISLYSPGLFFYRKYYSCGQSGTNATVHRYRDTFVIMEVFQIQEIIIEQALALQFIFNTHRNQVTVSNICNVSVHIISGQLKNKQPTSCHLFYCTSYSLNMFRVLLCPSSGARDYDVGYHIGRFVLGML
jgi:hypothetical protein